MSKFSYIKYRSTVRKWMRVTGREGEKAAELRLWQEEGSVCKLGHQHRDMAAQQVWDGKVAKLGLN